ncbi:MAG: thiamine pyrophosphate-requiring protein [Bauldia sp.]|uniref:thiamine pyrophosphate-requiring protein n=1 Tax=Bauldia sp. TaxID=2575872 RepID=UPI001D74546C|nr:thiamine pyrophosphate-requiring protein [Bauldia sp.]MCB1497598.1 thiamine pyrophosphate-requiring protein [Bauldia sp.]
MDTASTAILEALSGAGVSCLFANFGSDHPALVEAIAAAQATGREIPRVVTCPHEMVALSAAQGHAQVSGEAQAVVVHVDCGTQSLAGAVHNVARARVPVFIFAGLSPATQEGELFGSRNEFIHWLQDVPDQRGILRQYVKYENEIRAAANAGQIVRRSLQIAGSDPRGPVYLVAAREVLCAETASAAGDPAAWRPVAPAPLPGEAVVELAEALAGAHRPIIVTSYLGRNKDAVGELAKLCDRLGIGVLESAPGYVNFPHHDRLYQGNYWNQPVRNAELAEADVVLVIDSDIPWVPTVNRPNEKAAIFHIDVDPLKPSMPLWYIGARATFAADSLTALRQMNAWLDTATVDGNAADARRAHYARRHADRSARLAAAEKPDGDAITPEYLTACVRATIDDETIVLNEGITNYHTIFDHLARSRPGTMFTSGGSSLGWNGGAAIGAKLAAPERTVVSMTGDGSYMFSVPSTVHWMARRYATPFLQVVFNNRGWKAPKYSTLAVHPDGHASRAGDIGVSFDPPPDYSAIAAAAGGAFARKVERPEDVEGALAAGLRAVREEGRAAVLDVWLPHL